MQCSKALFLLEREREVHRIFWDVEQHFAWLICFLPGPGEKQVVSGGKTWGEEAPRQAYFYANVILRAFGS